MKNITNRPEATPSEAAASRRSFLRVAGAAAVTGGLLTACSNADENSVAPPGSARAAGTQFPYLQVMLVFWLMPMYWNSLKLLSTKWCWQNHTQICLQPIRVCGADIRGHEIIHRAFFKAARGQCSTRLDIQFLQHRLRSRADVLIAAEAFEERA